MFIPSDLLPIDETSSDELRSCERCDLPECTGDCVCADCDDTECNGDCVCAQCEREECLGDCDPMTVTQVVVYASLPECHQLIAQCRQQELHACAADGQYLGLVASARLL